MPVVTLNQFQFLKLLKEFTCECQCPCVCQRFIIKRMIKMNKAYTHKLFNISSPLLIKGSQKTRSG